MSYSKPIVHSDLLNDFMKQNNMSMNKFCEWCNISVSTLELILQGSFEVSTLEVLKICKKTKINIDKLFEI